MRGHRLRDGYATLALLVGAAGVFSSGPSTFAGAHCLEVAGQFCADHTPGAVTPETDSGYGLFREAGGAPPRTGGGVPLADGFTAVAADDTPVGATSAVSGRTTTAQPRTSGARLLGMSAAPANAPPTT